MDVDEKLSAFRQSQADKLHKLACGRGPVDTLNWDVLAALHKSCDREYWANFPIAESLDAQNAVEFPTPCNESISESLWEDSARGHKTADIESINTVPEAVHLAVASSPRPGTGRSFGAPTLCEKKAPSLQTEATSRCSDGRISSVACSSLHESDLERSVSGMDSFCGGDLDRTWVSKGTQYDMSTILEDTTSESPKRAVKRKIPLAKQASSKSIPSLKSAFSGSVHEVSSSSLGNSTMSMSATSLSPTRAPTHKPRPHPSKKQPPRPIAPATPSRVARAQGAPTLRSFSTSSLATTSLSSSIPSTKQVIGEKRPQAARMQHNDGRHANGAGDPSRRSQRAKVGKSVPMDNNDAHRSELFPTASSSTQRLKTLSTTSSMRKSPDIGTSMNIGSPRLSLQDSDSGWTREDSAWLRQGDSRMVIDDSEPVSNGSVGTCEASPRGTQSSLSADHWDAVDVDEFLFRMVQVLQKLQEPQKKATEIQLWDDLLFFFGRLRRLIVERKVAWCDFDFA